jgi:ubiquinone/menaquinone biosynthesis C-methylase UbiE
VLIHERNYYNQPELWQSDLLSIPAERERITKTIEIIPPDVRTILDLGCGNGALLNAISECYWTVGLDFSQQALKYVKTKAICGDIGALPFESASFDLVTCLEVLEHLSCGLFQKALSELQRVSKKYIIISVPNDENLDFSLVICPVCRCWYNPCRHLRSFNSEKLKNLFKFFALSELKQICPLERRHEYSRFLYSAYRLWRNAFPPSTAICPQCGYKLNREQTSNAATRSGNLLLYALRMLKPVAKLIWRPQWRRRWLLALYIRNGYDEQNQLIR